MATRDDILREKTHKGQTENLQQRVFYTLNDGKVTGLQAHRNSKAIALLVNHLHEQGALSDEAIDGILLECVGE